MSSVSLYILSFDWLIYLCIYVLLIINRHWLYARDTTFLHYYSLPSYSMARGGGDSPALMIDTSSEMDMDGDKLSDGTLSRKESYRSTSSSKSNPFSVKDLRAEKSSSISIRYVLLINEQGEVYAGTHVYTPTWVYRHIHVYKCFFDLGC